MLGELVEVGDMFFWPGVFASVDRTKKIVERTIVRPEGGGSPRGMGAGCTVHKQRANYLFVRESLWRAEAAVWSKCGTQRRGQGVDRTIEVRLASGIVNIMSPMEMEPLFSQIQQKKARLWDGHGMHL